MITESNFNNVLEYIGFKKEDIKNRYEKKFENVDCILQVDLDEKKLIYPEDRGFIVNDKTTCNFEHPENFVVFECINRLFEKGYRPEHIELEKRWNLGHNSKGGKADICVYDVDRKSMLCIIECKTYGKEYDKEFKNIKQDGGQLFSYWQQEKSTKWLSLYASNFEEDKITYITESINCNDDPNILELAKKDNSIKIYKNSYTVPELYDAWVETYEQKMCGDILFGENTQAYNIGEKPLKKGDLKDFEANDKIVNKFEEILRHNNVSDKENAFNRLIALFICKLVDEINKKDEDVVEFQYKVGTDTYESLQDRLQKLHQQGMEEFMKENIYYVADDYADSLVQQYTGQRRVNMINELKKTLRILKFYTNNDFAFKEVHNEELFYQNGKVLVEVVKLFEKYRIIKSNSLQLLGDLFEKLLNKGFKQNEGQFFTPIPIAKFVWNSLPMDLIIGDKDKIYFPKFIDYACGAGHFLTEGFAAIERYLKGLGVDIEGSSWLDKKMFGVEKDYRLARVSKISLFMHGAGSGNIVFGDGLENYNDREVTENSFDILVANPPYSVQAFKPHLNLKNNDFTLLESISNDGSEIETLFIERINQLLKPGGIAAVILPDSIIRKDISSFIGARDILLNNFAIKAIVRLENKTFGATGQPTVVLFLQKFLEPPKKSALIDDSVEAIFDTRDLTEWEDNDILNAYLEKIEVDKDAYIQMINVEKDYFEWEDNEYFNEYLSFFYETSEYQNKLQRKEDGKEEEESFRTWCNAKVYNIMHTTEKEKLKIFALVYKQSTLVVSVPQDIKFQERFLGYKWSGRKGMEGIQIIKQGGMLYDENNRRSDDVLAGMIRNSFYNNQFVLEEYNGFAYYNNLSDMIDFEDVNFSKYIKISRPRVRQKRENYTNYKLSNKVFDVSIGRRVKATDLKDKGKVPVYSANVYNIFGYIDKLLLTDFSLPSIVWGIDGDWMVNIIEANKQFYPTDHCGVIRIKTDKVLPKYLAMALEVEGKLEGFSRANRASTDRIRKIKVMIPDSISEQERIIKEIQEAKSQKHKDELIYQYFIV